MSESGIFKAAVKLPPEQRAVYLDQACASNAELRHEIDSLLRAHDASGNFLQDDSSLRQLTPHYEPITERPGTTIGPYKLLQQIGEGGFGVVYMAEQERPVRRMVALKIIKPGMDTAQVIARFESERQALALMDHPNIARVLDAGATDSGHPYFVMELVKGVTITEFCDKNHMPAEGRLKLFIDVCHAIQHAHHKGVIHRDIKPSNVMVTLHDGVPVVKVIDFGVAKATVQKLTERTLFTAYGQMIGTPAYMSPEQAEMSGLDIDTRSDVYSLGVLLYELLTGTTPLDMKQLREAGYAEMQRLIRDEPAPRPSTRMSSLGDSATVLAGNRGLEVRKLAQLLAGDLDWVVMKALDKDRNRRYETPGNFAEDIERYLQREAILARPPSTAYKLKKFTQRNRAAVVTGAGVALLLLIGIGGTTYGLFRAEQRRGEAEHARTEESKQRELVTVEQARTQDALRKSRSSELKAVEAERAALREAANSGCDVAQQLCDQNKVAQGLIEYGRALRFANEGKDADLEDAIRLNIGTWTSEMHALAYTIRTPRAWPPSAFQPAGKLLAIGYNYNTAKSVMIRLYDAADGTPRSETLQIDGPTRVYRLTWQPNGESLGIYTGDGWVHIWKLGQPHPTISFPVDPGGKYFDEVTFPSLAFSPDGSRLIAGTSQAVPTIFDTATGKPTEIQLASGNPDRHEFWATAVDWSRDGTRLLTGNSSGCARIWDAKTGQLIREVKACQRAIAALRFSTNGDLFVCASGFGIPELKVWQTNTGERVGPPMIHYENLYDAEFSPDGKLVVAADSGCEAFVWEVGSSRIIGAPIWTGGHSVFATFHAEGRKVLTVTGNFVRVWTLAPEMKRSDISLADPEDVRLAPYYEKYRMSNPNLEKRRQRRIFHNLALSPDGICLIKYGFEPEGAGFEMIDAKENRPIRTLLDSILPDSSRAAAVYWKPDSREFVTASVMTIEIRDAATGKTKASIKNTEASSGSYRPDGARFAIATQDYNLRFFDTETWKPVGPVLPHTSKVLDSAYSRDGRVVFTADIASRTRLWHAATGKRIGPVLIGDSPRVCADNESFIIQDGDWKQAYRIPAPSAGEVAEVIRKIESLTGQRGVVSIGQRKPSSPSGG